MIVPPSMPMTSQNSPTSTLQFPHEPYSYPNSYASHHMIVDPNNLKFWQPYGVAKKLIIGNGNDLSINHVGFNQFFCI